MTGFDRNKAAADDALRRLEEDTERTQRRLETAVERIAEGVVKLLGGNSPPTYHSQHEGEPK